MTELRTYSQEVVMARKKAKKKTKAAAGQGKSARASRPRCGLCGKSTRVLRRPTAAATGSATMKRHTSCSRTLGTVARGTTAGTRSAVSIPATSTKGRGRSARRAAATSSRRCTSTTGRTSTTLRGSRILRRSSQRAAASAVVESCWRLVATPNSGTSTRAWTVPLGTCGTSCADDPRSRCRR